MGTTVQLDKTAFDEKVRSEGVAVVDFWAEWCGPCRMLAPTIDQLADSVGDKAIVGKVDIDSNQELAVEFGVSSIPTVIVFKDGQPVSRFVGIRQLGEYEQAVNEA